MKTIHIKKDQAGQFFTDGPNRKWIIEPGVTMSASADFVFESDFANTEVVVKGTIDHDSTAGSALGLFQSGGVVVAKSGKIFSDSNGVYLDYDGVGLVNNGLIQGARGVVVSGNGGSVTNNAEIKGEIGHGVKLENDGAELVNAKGGRVIGAVAVETQNNANESTRIENHGTLKGEDWAIDAGIGDDHIINRGKIVGSVLLGNGLNVFDTRGGTVSGDVAGGEDADTYLIDNASIAIFEADGNGYDTLKTSVSYVLEGNNAIEVLTATGKKNIDLTANDFANRLNGNKGDNVLDGMGGTDWLDGGKGDDVMAGGLGDDYLIFEKGGGHDRVTDFLPGVDTLYVHNFYLDGGYSELLDHMKVHKGNLIITIGDYRIVLEDMTSILESDVQFADT